MPFCVFCGEEISYLPFTCKYCGKTFCNKHRLPENHECSFELKHTPVIPTSSGDLKTQYPVIKVKKSSSFDKRFRKNKEAKKYEKQNRRRNIQFMRFSQPNLYGDNNFRGTKSLLLLIIVFSFISIISLILFSTGGIPIGFYIWLIITSPFNYLGGINLLVFLFMIIFLIFFFFMARNIEAFYGTKFLIQLYMFCALMKAIFFIILRTPFVLYTQSHILYIFPIELVIGGFLGILAFSLYPDLKRKRLFFFAFIPLKLSGKTILIGIIVIDLILGFFSLLIGDYYSFADYLSNLGGILGSYIIFSKKNKFGR